MLTFLLCSQAEPSRIIYVRVLISIHQDSQ